MNGAPILFVAGLGRCGTTMVMTMLDAGGFPVTGPRPSYEDAEKWRAGRPDMGWLLAQAGRAVKWIDPTRHFTLPGRLPVRPVIILLERAAREQARSQIKIVRSTVEGFNIAASLDRRAEKAMERSIRRDSPIMRAQLRGSAIVHQIMFEDVLENPFWAARKIGRLVAYHFNSDFDDGAAAEVVFPRLPACAPDFAMENIIQPAIAKKLEARNV
jgi:hypothetical protein